MLTIAAILSHAYSTMVRKGPRPLIICGPSGSGKSSLLKKLFKEYPKTFGFSVSHTTRKPRPGEQNAIHYHFVDRNNMQAAIALGQFLESAEFGGNLYGTSKQSVQHVQSLGKVCVLDIEIEGVKQIQNSDLNPVCVFILPPSIDELRSRLVGRNTETPDSLKKRLEQAAREIEFGQTEGIFHKVILNTHFEAAYVEFCEFIIAELQQQQTDGVFVDLTRNAAESA